MTESEGLEDEALGRGPAFTLVRFLLASGRQDQRRKHSEGVLVHSVTNNKIPQSR